MALIHRMARLLTADLHAVLDRIEEPEALVRQAIREMEDAIAEGDRRLQALEAEREAVTTRRAKTEASLRDLDGELDVCFAAANEALARRLVRRKLEAERVMQHLAERVEALDKSIVGERTTIAEQREQLDVMRQKAELLTERTRPSASRLGDDPGAARFTVGDDEVEVAFLRERQRRQQR